jgi:hypothetical protein
VHHQRLDMNLPPDIVNWLEQLFFEHNRQAARYDALSSTLTRLIHEAGPGVSIATILAIGLLIAAVLAYRPRLTRGSFWAPAFGVFGGTPRLYMHSRPASFCGVFSHSRRLRHGHSVSATIQLSKRQPRQ